MMAAVTLTRVSETLKENRWSAEFFEPQYLFEPSNDYKWVRIGRVLEQCQYGISISMNEEGKGFPIYRMNEIDNCFTTEAVKYAAITEKEFKQFELEYDDVVFNRTNSIDFVGRTGIYKGGAPSTFASYLVRVKTDRNYILPEFLTIYLNTKFGKGQIRRRAMHSINQANVSAAELKRILIPLIEIEKQMAIAELVNKAFELKTHSIERYNQATQLLEDALGLNNIEFKKEKSYTASASGIVLGKRADAEFFNPKLRHYWNHLEANSGVELVPITQFCTVTKFGNPDYAPSGTPIITQKHLGDISPEGFGTDPIASNSWVSKYSKAILRENDLLFYSVGAYLGKTNIWFNSETAVPASFITLLRPLTEADAGYLMVLLNSKYGLLQSKVFQSGTSQQYIYPKDIRQFKVPAIAQELKQKLYDLLKRSYNSKNESQSLLEQAKQEVETLIEQAAQTA